MAAALQQVVCTSCVAAPAASLSQRSTLSGRPLAARSSSSIRPAVISSRRSLTVYAGNPADGKNNRNPLTDGLFPKPGNSQSTDIKTQEGLVERINGRAAMLGFVIAIVTELFTHKSIVAQLEDYPAAKFGLLAVAAVVIVSSLAPAKTGVDDADAEAKAPDAFKPGREIINGRSAMLGFVALLATEAIKGGPLFG